MLVPDDAPAPDLEHGPLAELARATGGRVLAVRNGDAQQRALRLWSEVSQPSPFEGIQIDWHGTVVTSEGSVPARLESGEGVLITGWYHGQRPGPMYVQAELRGRRAGVRLRPASAALTRAALPLALVERPAVELLPPAALDRGDQDERARADLVRAAHRAGVATSSTALVLLDPKDGYARDRLAHARKWGPALYLRFPPPAERQLGEVAEARQEPRPAGPAARIPGPAARRTGELDKALVERLMKQHVVPAARACYQRAIRREPKLAGTVVIELEMARGEVQHAAVARSTAQSPIFSECLLDAAYATPVPRVALGDASETVVVARYPLRFRQTDRSIEVGPTEDRPGTPPVDPEDPLGGL